MPPVFLLFAHSLLLCHRLPLAAAPQQPQLLPAELKLGLGKARAFFSPYKVPVAVEVTALADRLAAVLGLEVSFGRSFCFPFDCAVRNPVC